MKHLIQTTANQLKKALPVFNPSHHSMQTVFLLMTGIAIGLSVPDRFLSAWPTLIWAGLLGIFVLVYLISMIRGYGYIVGITKPSVLLLLGVVLVIVDNDGLSANPEQTVPADKIKITGVVETVEVMRGSRQRVRLTRHEGELWPLTSSMDLRLITGRANPALKPGDIIEGFARINPPLPMLLPDSFDFTEHAYRQGYGATGFLDDIVVVAGQSPHMPSALRFHIQQRLYRYLDNDQAAVASALLVGLRGGISEDIREDFRASGLSHLLAISGLHMALFWGSIMALFRIILACFPHFSSRYPSLKIATLAALPFGIFYLVISGMPVSAVRAFLMLGLFMLAILMTRRGITLHNVALAAIVILVVDPHQLTQPAFQMSFAAVFALVAGWTFITARRWDIRIPSFIRYFGGIMLGSILAGGVTAPFVLHHFGVTSIWSILANLAGMPLMAFIIMPLGALSLAALPFGIDGLFMHLMGYGISLLLTVAGSVSEMPLSSLRSIPPTAMVLFTYSVGLMLIVLLDNKSKIYGLVTLVTACFLWVNTPRPIVAMTMLHNRSLAAINDGKHVYYSRKSSTPFEISIITRPFGLSNHLYIGDAPARHRQIEMITHHNGIRIAMVWRAWQLKTACPMADLILVMKSMNTDICPEKVIRRSDITSHGGMLAYHHDGQIDVHFVDGTQWIKRF